jgi:hypothetical protein
MATVPHSLEVAVAHARAWVEGSLAALDEDQHLHQLHMHHLQMSARRTMMQARRTMAWQHEAFSMVLHRSQIEAIGWHMLLPLAWDM